jgi:thioredoxin 1
MVEVTMENYDAEVVQSDLPVVVDIWGPKCGPCLALMPKVEELAAEYEGKIKFCKLNSQGNRKQLIALKVMALPGFLFYKGGEEKARMTGADVTIEKIKEQAEALLA